MMEGDSDMSENEIKITLFSNYILIDMVKKKTKSKLITPETVKQPLNSNNFDATVVKVSQEEGMIINVKVGDVVCLSANSLQTGQVMKIQGKQYFIVRETEVVGVFGEGYDVDDKELKLVIPPSTIVN